MRTLSIDRGRDEPVYEQVASHLRDLVASGALAPGTPLPPVRRLAGDLGVNLNTVARAYRLLEHEGFLVIREREGVAVARPAGRIRAAARDALVRELRATLARLRQVGMGRDELRAVTEREVRALARHGGEADE